MGHRCQNFVQSTPEVSQQVLTVIIGMEGRSDFLCSCFGLFDPSENKLKRTGRDAEFRALFVVLRIAINPVFEGAGMSKVNKQKVTKMASKTFLYV